MTREELKEHCQRQIQQFERVEKIMPVTSNDWKRYEEHKLILELLEQEPCEDIEEIREVMSCDADAETKCNMISNILTAKPHYFKQQELFEDEELDFIQPHKKIPVNLTVMGHCKDCKWWKDNDGVYRRGVGAESKCPINRREVLDGNGYCYMFEPQESEEEE